MNRPLAVLAIAALLLTACNSSGSGGSATPDPAIAFCPALATYGQSLTALEALTPTSSVDDYKSAVTTAKTALAGVVAVAGPFAGAQLNTLSTAQQQLEAAAGELGSDATPAQADEQLQPYLEAVTQEVALTYNAICNVNPTPSSAP
jgi:outer membrane murein-binding lipoprotein Lpp